MKKPSLPFSKGDQVTYTCSATGIITHDAFITFVCPEYVTVCTHQWDDPGTLHGYKQVNVVVLRTYWHTIKPHTSNEEIKESTV